MSDFEEYMSDIVVRTVPADVLAPFGAKASAGRVMTKLKGQSNCEESMSALWCCWPGAVNSFWPSDTIWCHRSGSTLAQVMAWCLTAASHYLNQYWLIISEVLWHSPKNNFTGSYQAAVLYNEFENCTFEITTSSPRANVWISTTMTRLHVLLTHLRMDKIAAISQTIFWDTFGWMKVLYFD